MPSLSDPFTSDREYPSWSKEEPPETPPETRRTQTNVLQGSTAAGARALGTQIVGFYFRAPVKSFFKMRVDYMQVARALHPAVQANQRWTIRQTTPGLLAHAIRVYGWRFIPRQVLPPMIANATVGAVLYSSYLQVLGSLHQPSGEKTKRVYPPPPFVSCFGAGFAAGGIQSLVAAPLDALVVRFKASDLLEGGYRSIWTYSKHKLHEIGVRGVFAGYTLSFWKEAMGYGAFFAAFEFVKQQAYFAYLTWYYGKRGNKDDHRHIVIRPHYALEPMFLLFAGASASIAQQIVQHPISKIQDVHYSRLESIDYVSKLTHKWWSLRSYQKSYEKTLEQCKIQADLVGGWRGWLYRGLMWNTLRQIPSTAAGLFVFELLRRRYGDSQKGITIEYEDRTILLR